MSENSKIEWTGSTWNPIRARLMTVERQPSKAIPGLDVMVQRWGYHCEHISPGCKNCYAERMNGRMLPAWGTGLDYNVPNREKVEIFLDEKELLKPLSWRKPRKVFVCSMTDLFADFVPDWMINRVFAVMSQASEHTFQVLTKRAERMRGFMNHPDRAEFVDCGGIEMGWCHANVDGRWPLPNVHLGVSVEDQQRADDRIPDLLATPAAVRWVSYEPALGLVDFSKWLSDDFIGDLLNGPCEQRPSLNWIVIGGESGPGARPFDIAWARSVIRQCRAAGVPVFVKQFGAVPIVAPCRQHHWDFGAAIGRKARFSPMDKMHPSTEAWRVHFGDRKGGDMSEWPEDLRVRQFPEDTHAQS